MSPSLPERIAESWVSGMENTDGTTGPHWTIEQTEVVKNQRGIQWDKTEFWVAMNLVYSKCSEIFREYGVRDKIFLYADMALAFLGGEGAASGNLSSYYRHILKH